MLEVRRPALVALAFVFLLPAFAKAAPSSDTKECISAFDQGQHLKTDHHLKEAHTRLLQCTREVCPSVLRADCAEVLRSVQTALPSVVFAADDGGKDVTDVKVTNGSDMLVSGLDGKAIDLDPGEYDFKFEHGANKPIVVHISLREGEKARVVKASFNPKKPEPQFKLVTPPRPTAGYVVPAIGVALGVAGFVVGGLSRLAFNGQRDDMSLPQDQGGCAPDCTQEERDQLSGKLVRANIGLGVGIGGLAIAVATWLIFTPSAKLVPSPSSAVLTW
jgi:hypothetical protein